MKFFLKCKLAPETKLEILRNLTWDYKDIQKYYDCCPATAIKVIQTARKRDSDGNTGGPIYNEHKAFADKVLNLVEGTSVEEEVNHSKKMLQIGLTKNWA